MRTVPLRDALGLAFAAVYLFSFREATKLAAEWGAFQFKNNQLFWKKFVLCSLPLLVLTPLVMYLPLSKVVAGLTITSSAGALRLIWDLIGVAAAIVLLGLFPRATKHVWSLVARRIMTKVTGEGGPGEGWLNPNKLLEKDLPDPRYSWQVVVVLGMFPLVILVHRVISGGFGLLTPTGVDLRNLFVAAYAGLCIVLHHMAKLRRYFYAESRPRWLLSTRMFLTVPCTILLPLGFGVLCYLWMLALAQEPNPYRLAVGILCLLVALPFPLYCNQSLLLVARHRAWATKQECPELYEGHTWTWKVCVVLAAVCMTGILYFSITRWRDLV